MDLGKKYLNFNEYKSLGGTILEVPFNSLEFRARKIVDNYTHNRLVEFDEQITEVKMCINELINEIIKYNTVGLKTSESVGSYSVSFNKPETKEQQSIYSNVIDTYLSECRLGNGIPYLYMR